jgi:hypothetical protein
MMTTPHGKAARVDKSSAGHHGSAKVGFGLTPPQPTYDGITYVIETERLTKTPDNGTPERGAA